MIEEWIDLLQKQKQIFKTNIQRNLIQNSSNSLTQQFQSIYLTALGADPIILGTIYSLSGAVNTALSIPLGMLADKIGIRKTLLATTLVSLSGAFLFSVSNTWTLAAIALILTTVGFNLNFTVCPMICGSVVESNERATVMGMCDTIIFIPFLIGPILAASLITYFGGMNITGIRPLFYLQFSGLLLSLLLIWSMFSDPLQTEKKNDLGILDALKGILSENKVISSWIVFYMLSSFPYYASFYTPLFAAEVKGADQFIIGGLSSASTLISIVLAVPIGHMADKIGRKNIFVSTTILSCISYLLLVFAPGDAVLILSGLLSGFVMPMMVVLSAVSFDLVSKDHLGSWVGILGFVGGLSNILAPVICGFIWNNFSPSSVFFFLIFVRIISLLMMTAIPPKIIR